MRQRVDPFIPVQRHPRPPAGAYGRQYLKKPETQAIQQEQNKPVPQPPAHASKAPHAQRQVMDGVLRSPHLHRSAAPPMVMHATHAVPIHRSILHTPSPAPSKDRTDSRRLPQLLQTALLIIGAVCVGLAIQSLVFGEIAIGIYAVLAFMRHIASHVTFILALSALAGVVLLVCVQGDGTLSNTFAVYAFLLLVVGTASLGLEMRHERETV